MEFISLHRNRNNHLSAIFDQIIYQSKESIAKHLSGFEDYKITEKQIVALNPYCSILFIIQELQFTVSSHVIG